MKVANGKCIRRLGLRALRAGRSRNIVAALAIALTALLFTSLITIALSVTRAYSRRAFARPGATPTVASSTSRRGSSMS